MINNTNHIPTGYKSSPLGIIPENWEVKRLGDCFNISAGRDLEKDYYSETITPECRYPIFSNSLENKGLYGYTSKPRHYANSITITGRGSLGHAEYRDSDFDAIIRLLVLTPKIDISCELITNYINFAEPFIYESTGVPQLTAPQIQNTLLLLPPFEEQLQIMCFLKLWDTAIAKQTLLIEKFTLRKKGLMQQLLTGKKRLKGFEGKAFKLMPFNEIAETVNVKAFQINKSDYQDLGGTPVVDQGQAFIAAYSDSPTVYQDVPFVLFGDHTRIVKWIDFPCIIGADGVQAIKSTKRTDIKYLYYLLSNTSLPNLGYSRHMSILKEKVFRVPANIKEQQAIAKCLTNADKEIEIQKQKLAALQEQKKGLMQGLLSGKKRIK